MEYISNARVVWTSKLVDRININNAEYNPKEVFIYLDLSKTDKQLNIVSKNFTSSVDLIFYYQCLELLYQTLINSASYVLDINLLKLFYKKTWH